jgi:Mannosyltransferase (PIG-V)
VFAFWRLLHLAVTVATGGDAVDSGFSWDGNVYRRIFESGYEDPAAFQPDTAFFPLVSWLAQVPDLLIDSTASMVLTANVAALAAFVAVWGAATSWRDERLGRASVVLLALWPASLFYWSFYSEAVFVAASAGAVWADRRGHRVVTAVLLAGAAAARSIGVLVAAVLVGVRVWRQRRVDSTAVLYTVAALAGIGAVMYAQYRQAGDALAFVHPQSDWGRSLTAPWVTLRDGIGALNGLGTPREKWLDLVGITAVGAALLWSLWPRSRRRLSLRLPVEVPLLTIAVLALPLCSGVLSSMNRYVAGAWSGFVLLAAWLSTVDLRIRAAVYGALALASIYFVRWWADGIWLG